MIKISVLVPAYNEAKHIERCIRSLQNQHGQQLSYEILVQDDCSVDATQEVCKQFSKNIFYERNIENIGLPGSLNRALERAQGEYLVRVDADDYVSSSYIKFLELALDANQNHDAVSCDYLLVDETEGIICRKKFADAPIGCAVMFRRSVFDEIGTYNQFFKCHEDKEFLNRFYKSGLNMLNLPIPLYRYRQHLGNMTKNMANMSYFEKFL